MSKADFDDAIADIKNAAFSRQGLKGLRSIRALLIDVAFRQELEEIIARSHNQPEERAAIVAALAEIKFAFSDQRAERTEQHSQTGLVAIGGGSCIVRRCDFGGGDPNSDFRLAFCSAAGHRHIFRLAGN